MDKEISINFTMNVSEYDETREIGDFAIYPNRDKGQIEINLTSSNRMIIDYVISCLRDCADALEDNLPTNNTLLH